MPRRKTTEEFKKEVHDLQGNKYSVLGKYKNAQTKIKIRHNKCGFIYYVTPITFLEGHNRCPICFNNSGCNKKLAFRAFKYHVKILVGNNYSIIGKYSGCNHKIKMKHNKCGFIYYTYPSNFLKGYRCPKCSGHFVNTSIFKKRVKNLVGNEYTVLGKYKNNHTKIRIEHNKCGHIYNVNPHDFLKGCRCPYCYYKHCLYKSSKKKTTKQFKKEITELVGNEYTLLSSYKNNYTKVKMKHNKCGYIYYVRPLVFLEGCRCPKCAGRIHKNTSIFKREVRKLVGNEYSIIGQYKASNIRIKMRHNKCGYVYYVEPEEFLKGRRCPYCQHVAPMSTKLFRRRVHNLTGNKYSVLSRCCNSKSRIKMRHNKCGNIFYTTPNNFSNGRRCPICHSSHGEFKTKLFLKSVGLKNCTRIKSFKHNDNCFIHACTPTWLNGLHADFLLKINNKYIVIEFDGLQHFKAVDFSGKIHKYHELLKTINYGKLQRKIINKCIHYHKKYLEHRLLCGKKRDTEKDNLCKQNNVKMIRIKNIKNYQYSDLDKLILHTLNEKLTPIIGKKFSLAKKNNLCSNNKKHHIKMHQMNLFKDY